MSGYESAVKVFGFLFKAGGEAIEKVQDPEFQNSVKTSVANGYQNTKDFITGEHKTPTANDIKEDVKEDIEKVEEKLEDPK